MSSRVMSEIFRSRQRGSSSLVMMRVSSALDFFFVVFFEYHLARSSKVSTCFGCFELGAGVDPLVLHLHAELVGPSSRAFFSFNDSSMVKRRVRSVPGMR